MVIAREAIEKDYKALEEAYHKGNADTISLMCEDDAELFFPGAPVIAGRQAIREAWRRIIGSGGNTERDGRQDNGPCEFGAKYGAVCRHHPSLTSRKLGRQRL